MTEKEKFEQWLEKEKDNGLVDIKISFKEGISCVDTESIYRELNELNQALEQGNYKDITAERIM